MLIVHNNINNNQNNNNNYQNNNRITITSEVFFRIIESENLPSVFRQIDV